MSGPIDERLREFTSKLLERHGAEVDWPAEADQGLALLPPDVAQTLHSAETLPLATETGGPLPINLTSDFLDRVEPLVAAEPQVVSLRIPAAYLKRSDMSELVARTFAWLNARVRVQGAEPARVEYHTWYFLATLDSADRWQQVVRVSINASSRAQVQLPDMIDASAPAAEPADLPGEYRSTQLPAVRAALAQVQAESLPFVQRLESRLARDRKRLQDYYKALLRGDWKRTTRRTAEPDPAEKEAKTKAVKLELARKLAELDERYACRVDLTPLAVVRLDCPVLAVKCHVLRRAAGRMYTVYWNPLSRDLEPLACSRCGTSTYSLAFSDDKVAALCAACRG